MIFLIQHHEQPLRELPWRDSLMLSTIGRTSGRFSSLLFLIVILNGYGSAQATVATYHNDKGRTGNNLLETTLTPANVSPSQFGKLFSQFVDGFLYAQPLYVPNVSVTGL